MLVSVSYEFNALTVLQSTNEEPNSMAESDIAAAQGYENANLRKPLGVAEIGREASSLYHIFGADIHKRGNLSLIEDNIVVYACGNSIVFENYDSRTKQYLRGIEDGGIGSVAVHPSRKYFAVGAVGYQPNIYIYEYPSLKVLKILKGGAERGYASLSFNKSGEKLASVAMAPDFMLTVWDWAEERIGLHAKAFGQDVYSVRFSLDDEHRLTTCGTGHIRFWKMASTFTGLKLQGNIGKFGKVELSDIGAFVELPDGKVISGTESGALLLWEGNFIKCRFVQATGSSCHQGEVTYVEYDRREKCVITAGIDGYVRFWDFDTIDTAEVDSDHSMDFEILPLAEYRLPGGSTEAPRGVRCLVDSGTLSHGQRTWVIQDNRGSLCAVSFSIPSAGGSSEQGGSLVNYLQSVVPNEAQEYSDVPFWTFNVGHSRPVLSVDTSPRVPWAATCSGDGQVHIWDLDRRVPITGRKFDRSVTVVRFVPVSLDPLGMTLLLGFEDGIVRLFSVTSVGENQYELSLVMATKPHNSAITDMRFSPSGRYCATSSRDGNMFLLNCVTLEEDTNRWTPVRFVSLPKATGTTGKAAVYPERLSWGPEDDDYILCDCSDGKSRELCIKDLTKPLAAKTPVSVPQDAPTSEGGESAPSSESNPPPAEGTSDPATEEVVESFEVSVPIKVISTKVLVPSTASAAAPGSSAPSAEGTAAEGSSGPQNEATLSPIEVSSAVYSVGRPSRSIMMAGASGNRPLGLFEGAPPSSLSESPSTEVLYGLHSSDGKDGLRCPTIQGVRPTWSRRLMLVSSSDGSVAVLPVRFFEVYHSFVAHGGPGGIREAASSWDDRYVVTAGTDGMVSVQALRLDLVFSSGTENLARDIDAGVYSQQKVKKRGPTPEEEAAIPYLHLTTVCDDSQPLTLPGFPDQTPFLPGAEEVPPAVTLPPAPSVAVADMSSSSYSIQDAKLKSEEDSKRSSADILKDRVRAQIKSLRKEFSDLCKVNESFPKDVQLAGDRLNVDGDYWDLLLTRSLAQIDEVHKECAYDNEKALVVHKKVTEAFMQGLVVEEIKLSAFRRDDSNQSTYSRNSEIPFVMSLRTRGLDPSVIEILNEVRSQVRDESLEESQTLANEMAQKKALLTLDEMKDRLLKKDEQAKDGAGNNGTGEQTGTGEDGRPSTSPGQMIGATVAPGATGTTNGAALRNTSSVVRREMRRQRKSALSSHESEKPREDEDDVRDITAIRVAEKTLGDYKLKSGEDYEISEDQRVNAAKKRQQMALVEDTMVSMRLQFNEKFLQLRDLKRQIVYSVRKDNARIRAIDSELSQPDLSRSLWEPTLDPSEFPDDRDEVTRDELDRFEASKKGSKSGTIETVPAPPANCRITGVKTQVVRNPVSGAYRTDQRPALSLSEMKRDDVRISEAKDQDENNDPLQSQSSSDGSKKAHYEVDDSVLSRYSNPSQSKSKGSSSSSSSHVSRQRLRSLEEAVPVLRGIRVAKAKRMEINRPTDFVKEICQERRKLLEFERRMLLERIDKSVKAFADAIYELRVERHNLLSDLKLGELRLMTLYREYTLLLTFESRDLALQQKQLRCQGEKTEIANNMKESKAKLDGKMEELKSWQDKMTALLADLSPLLPDNNVAISEQLMKIFKKKIKRSKSGDNENEDEDDEDDDVDDDDEDDEEVEDVCPPGFDPQAYEKIIDLRDRRLDIDEAVSDIQKAIEDLKKSTDRLKQREKQIVKDAQQTESEVQQFQLQKQAALNQIDVLIPLTFSQMYAFEGSGVFTAPSDRPRPLDIAVEGSELIDQANKVRDINTRTLCAQIDMNSQVLFNKQALQRLDVRIHELHKECEESSVNFKELHKERVRLKREKQSREEEIEGLLKKCNDLQMLKFGRIMDLDELEAGADRSKEEEAEVGLRDIELQSRLEQIKLIKEIDALKGQLTKITTESTDILSQIANLTETKLQLDRDLKESAPGAGQDVIGESTKEREERERIVTYIKLQAKEIESLRAEIAMLKRKDAPPIAIPALPLPPGTQPAEPFLPPIPNNQSSKRSLK